MKTGQEFVAHYPSMFTEDTEWWAQKLDEHFASNKKEIEYTEEDMQNCFTAGVKFARDMMKNPSNTEYMMQIKKSKQDGNAPKTVL